MADDPEVTFRHKSYCAEKRVDPVDGKAYTWHLLSEYYTKKGWCQDEVEQYWAGLESHNLGRTRTHKKIVYPDDHPVAKARKRAAANSSRWEAHS